ncbi:tetratricopeptide repeat protein [Micromonosporaceae bacterium B7E4]
MRFRVLGRVVAFSERGQVPLGPARQRTVLAALLVEPGSLVSVDVLVDRVWGPARPSRARQTLHTYLSRLRGVLGDAGGPVPARRSSAYTLEVDESAVDLHHFRALARQARQVADDDHAAALWHGAMALWQGRPFADLDSDWLRMVTVGLEAERLAAALDRNDVLLRRGEHAQLLPELTTAASAYPLDERLAGQLILALYRCGRQADALAQYRLLRDRLVDELGSDPGPALRELQQRILRHDPDLAATTTTETPDRTGAPIETLTGPPGSPAGRPGAAVGLPHRPAQLPADVAGFTGRATDLRRLDELLGHPIGDQAPQAVVVTAIGGTAGVGKTALAVHWAHRVADRFPDGQLYVNLRGYDPDQPMSPADALARFLTALGVTGQDIPLDLDERAARYRSEVAGRRILIVLDNAANVAQVRPLLPGTGSCLVVVTSRDSLAGLVAVDGAHRLDLDLLAPAEAVSLLRRLIGVRVEIEPEAAATLAEQCARLPLALRVAAELVVARPDSTLAELVTELADRQARLELLDAGSDPYAAVREVFSWSIQQVPLDAARTFRLLGLHPGPDLDPYAVAALTDAGLDQARRTLALLARAHLVHRGGRGRYGMHDLLRAYAAHLAASEETVEQRRAAQQRLFDYYQAATVSATNTLYPANANHMPEVVASITPIPEFADPDGAYAWLEDERFCLVAAAAHTAAQGNSSYPVRLARILERYLDAGYPTDALVINGHAHRAAEQAGDLVGQAHTLRLLGDAYNRMCRHDEAVDHLQRALTRFTQAGDRVGEALALSGLGIAVHRLGDHEHAIDNFRRSIELFRQAGDRLGEAKGLTNLGNVENRLGRGEGAARYHRQALVIFREGGAHFYEATTLNNLANAELRLGRYAVAADHLRQSLTLLEQLGSPRAEAHIRDTLGNVHLRRGEWEQAVACFQQALTICRRIGDWYGKVWALNGLGDAAQLAGRPAEALGHYTEALAIAADTGNRYQQARVHTGLGNAHRVLGNPDLARIHYEQAYATYTELGVPEAEDVRARLAALTSNGERSVIGASHLDAPPSRFSAKRRHEA